jgi:4-hydroxy-4-methyl-2-oxoglutarate aldolase
MPICGVEKGRAVLAIDYAEFARLGVATVYEASGKEGLIDIELRQLVQGSRVAGPARTVYCGQDDNLMMHAAIELIKPGDIVVVTMPEPRPVAVIGDLLVTQIKAHGAAGVLMDASVRDIEELISIGLPIWTRYVRVRGATKDTVGDLDVPVTVGGAKIAPGDIVILDADGACVVAASRASDVLDASRKREQAEAQSRVRYAAGELSFDKYGMRDIVAASKGAR